MILQINGIMVGVDSLEVSASVDLIARQFSITDVSAFIKYPRGSTVTILSDNYELIIAGEIEHISAEVSENTASYTYSGRNWAKYLVDGYAKKTTQFSEGQDIITVFNKILSDFGLVALGEKAKLPKKSMKKILIGDKLADSFIEIAKVCGKIITSDAQGNILVVKKGEKPGLMPQIIGNNLNGRKYTENKTALYDKYTVISQSSRQKSKDRKTWISGSVGDGKLEKIIRASHPMDKSECEKMAKEEMKKDMQKAFTYEVTLKQSYMDINSVYSIMDELLGLNELMNLKSYTWKKSKSEDEYRAIFERLA